MKPIEQAFLADILGSPEDDAPRLIYADWLEENGQPERAEFIRVQIRIAREKPDPKRHIERNRESGRWERMDYCGKCPHCLLRRRERELLSEDSPVVDWLYEGEIEWDDLSPILRRGFVEEIALSLAEWLKHGPALVRAAPLRTVQITGRVKRWHEELRRLAQDDEPGDNPVCRLHVLDLSDLNNLDRWELRAAMNACYRPWRGLRCLILPNWANLLEQYRPYEIKTWKDRVSTLESVQFGREFAHAAN